VVKRRHTGSKTVRERATLLLASKTYDTKSDAQFAYCRLLVLITDKAGKLAYDIISPALAIAAKGRMTFDGAYHWIPNTKVICDPDFAEFY